MKKLLAGLCLLLTATAGCRETAERPPNILLVITDDQGWAQLGSHGNTILKTPHLDRLAAESVELTRFYVSPVCAPTRASLMTGRYNYRTGVVDTYLGRAMMDGEEVTLAELLGGAGYRTGIFGKWHLGDNYPMRAIDQGFQKAIIHKGGGIGQPSDPVRTSYFDPILQHDGKEQTYTGYCTDIFFKEATSFIEESGEKPFFVYLPTNSPHAPYDVPDSYIQPYLEQGLEEKDARIYGMITNIDENIGRLMEKLRELNLEQNTIVIFMTDNGPTTRHYTAGLRAQKGSVYDGGIRVPFLLRWPSRLAPRQIDRIAAHIDVLPTLLEAAGLEPKPGVDGISLLPYLEDPDLAWPERRIFIQSHRGNVPQLNRSFAVIGQRLKLVQALHFAQAPPPDAPLELYDLQADPGEEADLAGQNPEAVQELHQEYLKWFEDVSASRGYDPPRIHLGTPHEDPVILTRQDWRVVGEDGWSDDHLGYWEVKVTKPGDYRIQMHFPPREADGKLELQVQDVRQVVELKAGNSEAVFEQVPLAAGDSRLEARILSGGRAVGVHHVNVWGPKE